MHRQMRYQKPRRRTHCTKPIVFEPSVGGIAHCHSESIMDNQKGEYNRFRSGCKCGAPRQAGRQLGAGSPRAVRPARCNHRTPDTAVEAARRFRYVQTLCDIAKSVIASLVVWVIRALLAILLLGLGNHIGAPPASECQPIADTISEQMARTQIDAHGEPTVD